MRRPSDQEQTGWVFLLASAAGVGLLLWFLVSRSSEQSTKGKTDCQVATCPAPSVPRYVSGMYGPNFCACVPPETVED